MLTLPAVAPGLAQVLRSAGYGPQGLSAALGRSLTDQNTRDNGHPQRTPWTGVARVAPSRAGATVLVHRLAAASALATLARLFLLGTPVRRA